MRRVMLIFTVALAGLATVGAGAADAYHLGGRKWPTRTITYHSSAKQYKSALRDAVRLWNTSGVKIRFKAARRSKAKLKIVYGHYAGQSGLATLGYSPNATVWFKRLSKARARQPFYQRFMLLTAVHELGHVLGLQHNHPACSVMSYQRDENCPKPPLPWQYRCRLIERDDLKGVLKRYGGKAKPLAPEFCDDYPPPAPPTGLVATYDPDAYAVNVQWITGASPNVARTLGTISRDECTSYDDIPWNLGTPTPGSPGSELLSPDRGPGRYCVTLWSTDSKRRVGPTVSTWVDVPED